MSRTRLRRGGRARQIFTPSNVAGLGPGAENLQLLLDYENWTAGDPLPNVYSDNSGITSLADNNTVREETESPLVETKSATYDGSFNEHHTGPTDRPNFEGKDFYVSFFVNVSKEGWICHHSYDENTSSWEGWELRLNGGAFEFYINEDSSSTSSNVADSPYSTGEIYLVEAWYTLLGPMMHLRVNNNNEVTTSTSITPTYPDRELGIGGRHSWSTSFFTGRLDNFLYEVAPQGDLFWPNHSTWLYNGGAGRSSDEILNYNP